MIHFSADQWTGFHILVALVLYGLVMLFLWQKNGQTDRKKENTFININGVFLVNILTDS